MITVLKKKDEWVSSHQGKEPSNSPDELKSMCKGERETKRKCKNNKLISVVIVTDWKQIVQ